MEQLTPAVEWISRHSKHKRANNAVMKLALAATVYHICLEGNSRTLIAKLEASIDSLVPGFSVLPVNRNSSRVEEGPLIRGNYSQTQSGIAP